MVTVEARWQHDYAAMKNPFSSKASENAEASTVATKSQPKTHFASPSDRTTRKDPKSLHQYQVTSAPEETTSSIRVLTAPLERKKHVPFYHLFHHIQAGINRLRCKVAHSISLKAVEHNLKTLDGMLQTRCIGEISPRSVDAIIASVQQLPKFERKKVPDSELEAVLQSLARLRTMIECMQGQAHIEELAQYGAVEKDLHLLLEQVKLMPVTPVTAQLRSQLVSVTEMDEHAPLSRQSTPSRANDYLHFLSELHKAGIPDHTCNEILQETAQRSPVHRLERRNLIRTLYRAGYPDAARKIADKSEDQHAYWIATSDVASPEKWICDVKLADLQELLKDSSLDWQGIGLRLGLKIHSIQGIYLSNRGDIDRCKRDVLQAFLDGKDMVAARHNGKFDRNLFLKLVHADPTLPPPDFSDRTPAASNESKSYYVTQASEDPHGRINHPQVLVKTLLNSVDARGKPAISHWKAIAKALDVDIRQVSTHLHNDPVAAAISVIDLWTSRDLKATEHRFNNVMTNLELKPYSRSDDVPPYPVSSDDIVAFEDIHPASWQAMAISLGLPIYQVWTIDIENHSHVQMCRCTLEKWLSSLSSPPTTATLYQALLTAGDEKAAAKLKQFCSR